MNVQLLYINIFSHFFFNTLYIFKGLKMDDLVFKRQPRAATSTALGTVYNME